MAIKDKLHWRKNKTKEYEEPVRLERRIVEEKYPPKKYDYTPLLLIIAVMIILITVVYIIYFSGGSLESTNYYYRLDKTIAFFINFKFI